MKTVIVTGAAGGMGQKIVQQLLEENYVVVGLDLAADHPLEYPYFQYHQCDVTDERMIEPIVESHSNVYGLINVHGLAQAATPIEEVTADYWDKLMNVNVKSLFLLAKAVVPKMKSANDGVIINIASISAVRPRPGLQAYIASKGAAESFSRAMAIELAPYNVRVNTIHPGPANTSMLGQFAAADSDVEQAKAQIFASSVPLGRLIEPQDIANAVRFLLQEQSSIITGTTLHVDGGRGL
ncbi:SDR family NAD(P)-dependent oxidoreductase [Solibacillus sp. FSL W7-1324]|uniref:SDR family NAD(P)-dependent oxidoreductase n=1 Tax=Solibacillus sp. FSL W7-1324 TaxID=2921701 RepID=UPI0030FBBAAC